MKKILLFFLVIQLIVTSNVFAQDTQTDEFSINIGSPFFSQEQGDNGWYLCQYNSGIVSELIWSDEALGWTSGGDKPVRVSRDELVPGLNEDLDFKFVVNRDGYYALSWDIEWSFGAASGRDGMTLSVLHNNAVLWEKNLAITKPSEFYMKVMLKAGDELHFRANCNESRGYDSFRGYPMVELVGEFYQKNESGISELSKDRCNKAYIADDLLARISENIVMPTEEYAVVRRYIFPDSGRYRIYGKISSDDKHGSGNVIRFYKNGEIVREQLCLSGEDTLIDLRMLCDKRDILDIEVEVAEYEGFNFSTWDLQIESIPGTVRDCENTTTAGYSYSVTESKTLSEYISNAEQMGTKLYTKIQSIRYPMKYEANTGRWEETSLDKSGVTKIPKKPRETMEDYMNRTIIADAGYVTPSAVCATRNWTPNSWTIIDVPITKSGKMLIDGNFKLTQEADAEIAKVYLNDELVWSNRIGGEASIRFDEPYDTKYFIDNIHTILNVSAGDVLSFRFNLWRKQTATETIDISNVKLNYIEGNILSKTTKWKLNNAIVVDTQNGNVYVDGKYKSNAAYMENGTTYISAGLANELFGYNGGVDGVALRTIAEENGRTVVWAANRFAIVHKGISGMFTWNDLSEIKTQSELNGGALYE